MASDSSAFCPINAPPLSRNKKVQYFDLSQVRNAASRSAARAGAGVVEVLLDLEILLSGQDAILSRFSGRPISVDKLLHVENEVRPYRYRCLAELMYLDVFICQMTTGKSRGEGGGVYPSSGTTCCQQGC